MRLRCKTCRIRKVKCDGNRPACDRCTLTGRICDGFGIWGGGSEQTRHIRSSLAAGAISAVPQSIDSIRLANASEREAFDWFVSWTTLKLPGLFASSFWSTLVLQSCHSEPAVLSAALAVGLAHRARPTLPPCPKDHSIYVMDADERVCLQHFTAAIKHLRERHSAKRSKTSLHIALITCVLFACTELIRGHYKAGEGLLRHGIKLLQDRNTQLKQSGGMGDAEDDSIREALERLCVPAIQLGGPSLWRAEGDDTIQSKRREPPTRIEILHNARYPIPSGPPLIFESMLQARESLDRILHATLDIAKQFHGVQSLPIHGRAELLSTQSQLQMKLRSWHMSFVASRVHISTQHGNISTVAYQMLHRYYNMTFIMLGTYTRPGDQMAFDSYTAAFLAIVKTSAVLYDSILVQQALKGTVFSHREDVARFVADRGWIMPLFYTATKCRIHPIRMRAIQLLEMSFTREGVWDSRLAAGVARRIVKIEDTEFDDAESTSYGTFLEGATIEDLAQLPTTPEANRLYESHIELPSDCWGRTLVHSRRRRADGTEETLIREYDPAV